MAYQDDTVTELFVLSIGDGAAPEVFTPLCSFAAGARSFEFMTEFTAREVADCAAPTNPNQVKRAAKSQDWSFSIDGTCNAGDDKTVLDWAKSGAAKNVKIVNTNTGAVTIAGSAFVQNVTLSGSGKGEAVNLSMQLVGNGLPTFTATA